MNRVRFAFTQPACWPPQGCLDDHAVLVEDGRIAAVLPTPALDGRRPARRDLAGATGAWLHRLPGQRRRRRLFNDAPDLATLERLAAAHALRHLPVLPTLISSDAVHIEVAVATAMPPADAMPAV